MKKVLIIIPFDGIYPPMNGGMLRCINLLHQLTKHFEVTAIIHQDKDGFLQAIKEYPSLQKLTLLSTKHNPPPRDLFAFLPDRIANSIRYRFWNRSVKGPAEGNFLRIYPLLKTLMKNKRFDYIILEELANLNLVKIIRAVMPGASIIYDAYNVNTRLYEAAYRSGKISLKELELTRRLESSLSKLVNLVFTCSEHDLNQFKEMNRGTIKGLVIPNGVTLKRELTGSKNGSNEERVLFCGNLDYLPNQEGLLWFCREILPLLVKQKPSVRVMVVGKGNPGAELNAALKHPAIDFYGMVDNVSDYYFKATLALVPLITGSGTRLKVLEAMGHGVPVVSTTVGAEGIEYTAEENIGLADDATAFAGKIVQLLNDKQRAHLMADAAYRLMEEKYDWNVIGRILNKNLN